MLTRDLYQSVTAEVVSLIEQGTMPWTSPFSTVLPHNAVTGHVYRGQNTLLLWLACMRHGYEQPRFMTFKQAQSVGASIRKGEKAQPIVFVSYTQKDDEEEGRPFAKVTYAFNVSQVDNLPPVYNPAPKVWDKDEQYEKAYDFSNRLPIEVEYGASGAAYLPHMDVVHMPHADRFDTAQDFLQTLWHEAAHWTSHPTRCNRTLGKRFGDKAYALEECVAEMASAFICAEFGYRAVHRSAAYVENWLGVLKEDPRALFSIASYAGHAAKYLLDAATPAEPVTDSIAF